MSRRWMLDDQWWCTQTTPTRILVDGPSNHEHISGSLLELLMYAYLGKYGLNKLKNWKWNSSNLKCLQSEDSIWIWTNKHEA